MFPCPTASAGSDSPTARASGYPRLNIGSFPARAQVQQLRERLLVHLHPDADRLHVLFPQRVHLAIPRLGQRAAHDGKRLAVRRFAIAVAVAVLVAETIKERAGSRRIVERLRREARIVAVDAGRQQLVRRQRPARRTARESFRRRCSPSQSRAAAQPAHTRNSRRRSDRPWLK